MMFSEVNRDCSGHISEQELRLIIARIGLFVPRQELHILFLDRDTDGLGMMAFNELVHLIVHLTTRDNGVALPLVREAFLDLERTHDLSVDEEKCSVGYFERDEMDSVYGSDAGRIIRFKERRRSSADHVIAESKDGDVSSDADEADSSANQTSKHSKSSCLSFVSMPWGRNRRRYQVTPDEGEQTNSEHVAEQLSNRRLHHAVSAQNLLDAEDSRLMNVDSSQHLTDCMCGCRKIVELFDS